MAGRTALGAAVVHIKKVPWAGFTCSNCIWIATHVEDIQVPGRTVLGAPSVPLLHIKKVS